MFTQPMEIELQPHNGLIGRKRTIPPFEGAIIPLPKYLDPTKPPVDHVVETMDTGRTFTYAYTVAFETNGFYVFRENTRR